MIQLSYVSLENRQAADCLVVFCWQVEGGIKLSSDVIFPEAKAVLESGDFLAEEGELTTVYLSSQIEKRAVFLGCGQQLEASLEGLRRSVSFLVKLAKKKKWKSLNLLCPVDLKNSGYAITEGLYLSHYVFNTLKHDTVLKESDSCIETVSFIGLSAQEFAQCIRARDISLCVNFTRDLVNGNADDITPQQLIRVAKELALMYPTLETSVLEKEEMTQKGLGLILAVNRASCRGPALITIKYQGDPSSHHYTAVVGKGITYDTGGLNLKPRGSMETMKDDMSGAASVLGTLKAVAHLKLPVNVIGVIPSTENSIGSYSYKPGDVYKSYSGKTVEIADTDAEGRLVLADAISYLQDNYPVNTIIDLATLTGGIVVALGEHVTGLFSNNDHLASALTAAGENVYERLWRMPLYTEYKDALKSSIADIKNAGDRKASAINGAMFIQEFVKKELSWAHLDIAGTAYLSAPSHYHATPATGVGVRLLIEYFLNQIL